MVKTQKNIQKNWKNGRSSSSGRKKIHIFFHFPQNIGRIEEARQRYSEEMAKTLEMLEEWKKPWKKKIIQSYENIFFHFPKNIGRMEEARQKNSQDLAKTL